MYFLALWASVWAKNGGGGTSPGSATVFVHIHIERPVNGQCPVKSRLCLIKSLEDMDTLFSLSFKLLIMGNLIL